MWAAVESGDAKKVAELMRQDPGFDVNMDQDDSGWTLLHYACDRDSRSAVIPLLLAHPDIDVNRKTIDGCTPFFNSCQGNTYCVRELLKDSRVKVNEPNDARCTPLWWTAYEGHIESSSGGLRLEGRWISGNQVMTARRMPLGGQGGKDGQKRMWFETGELNTLLLGMSPT